MREWLEEKFGVIGAVVLLVVAVGAMAWMVMRKDPNVASSTDRRFICAQTGKTFAYTLKDGDRYPVHSPYSKSMTGWPAEACYWTRDGDAKREPTWVLLNSYIGVDEPTICPDCGRKVVRHNPVPPAEKWRELEAREGK